MMQLSVNRLDHRSKEILESIRGMFAEKGFDGASMQDLARAAGMSVGNFYRYFPSKDAIIEAIVARDMEEIATAFSQIMVAPDAMAAVRAKLHERIEMDLCGDDGPIWAEMSAAAFRKPAIARAMAGMHIGISRYLLATFAKATGLSEAEAEARFSAHAAFIMLLIKSTACAVKGPQGDPSDPRKLILRTVDAVLDEISAHAVKG